MDDGKRFDLLYRRWVYLQSVVLLTALVLASPLLPPSPAAVSLVLALWGAVAMGVLFVMGVGASPGGVGPISVNIVTAVRSMGAVALLIFVGLHGGRGGSLDSFGIGSFLPEARLGWVIFTALALVEITDNIDGRLARRLAHRAPPSRFGAIWDMENDSFFALALSLAAWQIVGIPVVVLLIGAMRYFYFILVRAEGDPPGDNPAYKLFAKSTTATLVIALIVIYLPFLPHGIRGAMVYGALGLQVISFSWDLVLRARAGSVINPDALTLFGRRRS